MFISIVKIGACCSAIAAVATIWMVGGTTASHADDAAHQPLQLAFRVDVLGHDLADANDADLPTPQTMEFNFAGLPVRFGTQDDATDPRLGLQAGFDGDYTLALGERLSLVTSASLNKTGYLNESGGVDSWGTDRATARTTLRYQQGGWILDLEPSWNLAMVETLVTARDYGAAVRFSKSLPQGFGVAGGLRYGRFDAQEPGDGFGTASAYAGLSYRLAGRIKVDLAYATNYTVSEDQQSGPLGFDDLGAAANSAGPTITMSFPLWDALDIAASYRYCRSTDTLPTEGDRKIEDVQSFDFSAVWRGEDSEIGGFNLTAAYAYDHLASSAPGRVSDSHAATLAFALPF